jgi:hypothetical protein
MASCERARGARAGQYCGGFVLFARLQLGHVAHRCRAHHRLVGHTTMIGSAGPHAQSQNTQNSCTCRGHLHMYRLSAPVLPRSQRAKPGNEGFTAGRHDKKQVSRLAIRTWLHGICRGSTCWLCAFVGISQLLRCHYRRVAPILQLECQSTSVVSFALMRRSPSEGAPLGTPA